MNNLELGARHRQLSNDLYWAIHDVEDGEILWIGYNDHYWWSHVSTSDQFRARTGKSGRTYTLDPRTSRVTVTK